MASASLFQTSVLSRSASRAVLSPVCSTAASVRCARSSASVAPGGWTARSVPACTPCVSGRCNRVVAQASEQGNTGSSRDPSLDGFVEVKVDQVRVNSGNAVVYLRILDGRERVLPVHIGENESNALVKEINKQRQMRPLTHDVMKNILREIKFRVVKIRITDIVANTYYARIHLAKVNDATGQPEPGTEVDVDARPSDAINLAVRFGSPMYVSKRIADAASTVYPDQPAAPNETASEIVRSVRETLASFEDPTVMYQLQKDLAVKEERFEDARSMQQLIYHEMTHNQLLRLVVAMESALSDGRYEEAARLRDEFRRLSANAPSEQRRT
ncbi:hypothetical protein CHLRE_16g688302v5 [Chlamydomonas reinhardtii]|uniref:Uncharacterized protein n=1 Tax=Chlamydomonas reinhardtii TaxID=3055 RepID=A8JAH7_CHLRE|nr:uncharacterized protein CHLRE_16g688302v5 [Chlamydomonas reinhardtii]PNW72526.1 hypothetical protein CHLRE_16g688302v5 [Chlamydomonas reinhardtii]|eukprot:XP_001698912.1 hypothetical protein CHLREDRAFT_205607 [Chlamydomonas reinhardtii]